MAIVYQNDKRAVKFIKDFYKQLTKKTPNQYQIDSILMNFDGDYDNMIMGMYSGLVGKHPTKDQMNQIKNRYGLKKRFGKWFIRIGNWRIGAVGNKKTV